MAIANDATSFSFSKYLNESPQYKVNFSLEK
jgi:hypothetical protein